MDMVAPTNHMNNRYEEGVFSEGQEVLSPADDNPFNYTGQDSQEDVRERRQNTQEDTYGTRLSYLKRDDTDAKTEKDKGHLNIQDNSKGLKSEASQSSLRGSLVINSIFSANVMAEAKKMQDEVANRIARVKAMQ